MRQQLGSPARVPTELGIDMVDLDGLPGPEQKPEEKTAEEG
jgi:hypothetical protein